MQRKLLFFILIALCFYITGCGDEGILREELLTPAAPSADMSAIGPVPTEIQEIIWGKDIPTLMLELEDAIDGSFISDRGTIVRDEDRTRARKLINKICLRREQEAYYTKYINAGGVAIMGHTSVDDRMFYAARDIVLGMTQKRPELRAVLTPMRENRPGALIRDGSHDVSRLGTPSRTFRYILYHQNMGSTSIPEKHLRGDSSSPQWTPARSIGHCFTDYCTQVVQVTNWGTALNPRWDLTMSGTFIHEFAHAIHYALRLIDPTFEDRLQAAYDEAVKNTHANSFFIEGSYALSNKGEYWAESAEVWFDDFTAPGFNGERQYARFIEQNPRMNALLTEWFDFIYLREVDWRY